MVKEVPKTAFETGLKFYDDIMGNFVVEEVSSFYELVDRFKEYNRGLGD